MTLQLGQSKISGVLFFINGSLLGRFRKPSVWFSPVL